MSRIQNRTDLTDQEKANRAKRFEAAMDEIGDALFDNEGWKTEGKAAVIRQGIVADKMESPFLVAGFTKDTEVQVYIRPELWSAVAGTEEHAHQWLDTIIARIGKAMHDALTIHIKKGAS